MSGSGCVTPDDARVAQLFAHPDVRAWLEANRDAAASLPRTDGAPVNQHAESRFAVGDIGTLLEPPQETDPEALALVRAAFRVLCRRKSTSLTDTQRSAVLLHLDGLDMAAIGRQLNVDRSAVSRALFGRGDHTRGWQRKSCGAYEVLANALASDPDFLMEAFAMKDKKDKPPRRPQELPTCAIAPSWFRKIHRGNIDQFGFFAVFLVLWSASKDGKLAYSDACAVLPASIIGPTLHTLSRFPHRLVDFDGVTITIRGTPVDDVIAGQDGAVSDE